MNAGPQRPLVEGILATDFYQITAAQAYWKHGLAERRAQFDHFFRSYPDYGSHAAGYCIAAGLDWLLEWMENSAFDEETLDVLRRHEDSAGNRMFEDGFLEWLAEHGNFSQVELLAAPEGRVVHANCPMTLARGPLAMLQILETPLLLHLNYPTLIATKAARIKQAGGGGLLMEFGARRAHDRAAHAGARAALIGGADFSSNTGISFDLGLPPKGTHAHALVQAHLADGESEREAFRSFAASQPDDCVLLVDTIDTLRSGVPNAIAVFEELRSDGHEPVGIRLDSGDLAHLTVRAARMLDDAGFEKVSIVLSNQLDEVVIQQIREQIVEEAPDFDLEPDAVLDRLAYGVGTSLITSQGAPSLDGVYKLTALEREGEWKPVLKLSETPEKIPTPGPKTIWRLYDTDDHAIVDLVAVEDEDPLGDDELELHHVVREGVHRCLPRAEIGRVEKLLETVFADGARVRESESLDAIRERRQEDLRHLHAGVRRIVHPHRYHVSLSDRMHARKRELIERYGVDAPDAQDEADATTRADATTEADQTTTDARPPDPTDD